MEYIDGQDLAELMRRGPLALGFAADVAHRRGARRWTTPTICEVAIDGKDFRGIVHGDIKPKNIRIDARGEVRVLDFGIAKALSLSRRLTRNEFGSVPYASPERLDSGDVDVGSDLWSLAVMLYEMVTGLQPYHAESTERLERMIRSRIAAASGARSLSRTAAPHPASRRWRPIPGCATRRRAIRRRSGSVPGRRSRARRERGSRRHAPHLPPARRCRRRRDAPHAPAGDETPRRRAARRRRAAPADADSADQSRRRDRRPPSTASPCGVRGACSLVGCCLASGPVISRLSALSARPAARARDRSRTAHRPDQIWTRWTELSKGNPSSFLLHGPRKVVKQKFAGGRRPRDRYLPQQRCSWFTRRTGNAPATMAARALAVDPDDTVRGKLRLCRRPPGAHQRHQPSQRAGTESGGGEVQRGAAAAAQIARSASSDWRASMSTG